MTHDQIERSISEAVDEILIGEEIGCGSFRRVHQHATDESKVVKVCYGATIDSNIIEWNIWYDHKEVDDYSIWLAPCNYMSNNGRIVIQDKMEIITSLHDSRLPKRIPRFLTDTKVTNWGVDNKGNVRCVDYGHSLLISGNPWQLKNAQWWEL